MNVPTPMHEATSLPARPARLGIARRSVLLLALTLAAAPGAAQNAAPAPAAKPAAESNVRPAGATRALSGDEQYAQAGSYLAEMRTIDGEIVRLAKQARAENDLLKLNCINDKLMQVRGHRSLAKQARAELRAASLRRDIAERNHQFSKLTIIYQRVTVLGQEAQACVGEEAAYVGQTQVDLEVDPDVADAGDPTTDGKTALPTDRPPLASPTT